MSPLIAKLFAIVVVTPLAFLAVYACLRPAWPLGYFLGFAPGVLILSSATGLAFYFIRQAINRGMAIVGAFVVAVVTLYLSMLLVMNTWGS